MSQLNKKSQTPLASSYEGNVQKTKSPEQQLYEIVSMTLLGRDKFYESSDDQVIKLKTLVDTLVKRGKIDFVANLAVHTRTNLNVRSMPIVLLVTLAERLRYRNMTYQHLRKAIANTIQRVDEITDMYAYALQVFGDKKAVPLAIKKGVADSFNKFDEYQFGKYKGKGKQLSVKDVLRIVHPKCKDEAQGFLFEKIVKESLDIPYTWETELSKNDGRSKKEVWEELIESKKVGYMGILRNLRNILDAGVSNNHINTVCDYISNPIAVANSKQFPYRFLSAMTAIAGHANNKVIRAISRAADLSLSNVPDLGDNVWVIVDCSSSMTMNWGQTSKEPIRPFAKAALFAAAIAKGNADADNFKLTMFSDTAKHVGINPDSPVIDIVQKMHSEVYGGGTNLNEALDLKDTLGFEPKTIVIFSDMQVSRLCPESKTFLNKPNMVKLAVNLDAYGTTPTHENNQWLQVSGYSDSIFNYIQIKNSGAGIVNQLSKSFLDLDSIKSL